MFLNVVFVFVYIAQIYLLLSEINHSDHKTRSNHGQLWPQRICRATNRKMHFLTTDLRVIMATCRATRKICFLSTTHGRLPSPSYKHSFLMTQALVTCCRRQASQNTCSFAETVHTSNLCGENVNITRAQSAFHSLLVFGVNCDLSLQLSTRDHKPLSGRQSSLFVLHFL